MRRPTRGKVKVEAVSKLPSLDELRAQIAGLVVSPATGLVTVLNSATGQVVNVIQAYLQEHESGGEGAAEAEAAS